LETTTSGIDWPNAGYLPVPLFKPVYYDAYSNQFPTVSNEEQGWWVGIATHVDDALTYKFLTENHKVI
jgi:hypothetical protein